MTVSSSPPEDATWSILKDEPVTYTMKTRCRQQLTTSTTVAVLSTAFVASLLASAPRSDALIARPYGLFQPLTAAAAARAASVRGESPSRGATRRFACVPITLSAGAISSAFCSLRATPISPPRRCGCRGGLSIALGASGDDHGPELEGEDGVVEGTIVGEVVEVEEARQGVQKTASTVASIPTSRCESFRRHMLFYLRLDLLPLDYRRHMLWVGVIEFMNHLCLVHGKSWVFTSNSQVYTVL